MSVEQAMAAHEGPWTEAAFLALPDDPRIELVDGALLVSPYSGMRHQRMASRLWHALTTACPAQMEVFETINVRIGPGRILIPDLVVVTRPGLDDAVCDSADVALLIEIVSPGSVATDRAIKPRLYAEAGIGFYVRIELVEPSSVVGRLVGDRYVIGDPSPVLRLTEPFEAEVDLPGLLATPWPGA